VARKPVDRGRFALDGEAVASLPIGPGAQRPPLLQEEGRAFFAAIANRRPVTVRRMGSHGFRGKGARGFRPTGYHSFSPDREPPDSRSIGDQAFSLDREPRAGRGQVARLVVSLADVSAARNPRCSRKTSRALRPSQDVGFPARVELEGRAGKSQLRAPQDGCKRGGRVAGLTSSRRLAKCLWGHVNVMMRCSAGWTRSIERRTL
jgi:hypothetical protein